MPFAEWQPGHVITARRLRDATPQAWTSWTPTWNTSSGNALPSFGNASVDCRYTIAGRKCDFFMDIRFGSTTDFGTGAGGGDNWLFGLPRTAALSGAPIGMASYFIGSSTDATPGLAILNNTNELWLYVGGGDVDNSPIGIGIADSLTPITWADNDRFIVNGHYELAS